MEKKFKRTTVTSALPYANGPVHIGHLAGVYVPADIYVRYLRLKKEEHPRQERRLHAARYRGPLSRAHQKVVRRIRHFVRCLWTHHVAGAP